jgi:hypothetical protein
MAVEKFTLTVDEDEFTIGDLEDFEGVAGIGLDEALKPTFVLDDDGNKILDEKGRPEKTVRLSPTALKALIWVTKRRTVPGFSVEDARNVRVTSLEIAEAGEPDPKETGD